MLASAIAIAQSCGGSDSNGLGSGAGKIIGILMRVDPAVSSTSWAKELFLEAAD